MLKPGAFWESTLVVGAAASETVRFRPLAMMVRIHHLPSCYNKNYSPVANQFGKGGHQPGYWTQYLQWVWRCGFESRAGDFTSVPCQTFLSLLIPTGATPRALHFLHQMVHHYVHLIPWRRWMKPWLPTGTMLSPNMTLFTTLVM